MASICILLPGKLDRPIGGHKVIYQHANYLVQNGNEVLIANNIFAPTQKNIAFETLRMIHALLRFLLKRVKQEDTCRGWFELDASVQVIKVWDFHYKHMPIVDTYMATNATTSPFLESYPVPSENKFYFVQDYENWNMSEEQLRNTYHFHCKILVISQWLKRIMEEEGVSCRVVPNGYDSSEFFLTIPIEKKDSHRISMLYHQDERKNIGLGLKALALVHEQVPDIQVSMFGVYDEPQDLPSYIKYTQCPDRVSHNSLNNSAAIFIGTSNVEGWGLTVLEAMACGQAVVCTDNEGYLEMAEHNINALVSPVGDAKLMAENIIDLINHDEKRIRLAKEAVKTASLYTIKKSNQLFADCLRMNSWAI